MSGDIVITERPSEPWSTEACVRGLAEEYEQRRTPKLTEEQRAMRDGTHPDAPKAIEPDPTDASDPAWRAIVQMHGQPAYAEPNRRDGWLSTGHYSNVEWGVGTGQELLEHAPTPYAGDDYATLPCFVLVLPATSPTAHQSITFRDELKQSLLVLLITIAGIWLFIGALALAGATLHL